MTQLEQNFLEAATRFYKEHRVKDDHNIKEIDWEQRRYEIARDTLIGLLSSPGRTDVVHKAIEFADELIEELKK